MKHILRLFFALSLLGTISSCRNDSITTYQTPKDSIEEAEPHRRPLSENSLPPGHPPIGKAGEMTNAPADPEKEIRWTLPEGWIEQAPSSMRVGSFLIRGNTSQQADISVIPLSGDAGGDLANINRWRGQISLPPLLEADLASKSETISPAGRKMLFISFSNQNKRLMAAIYHRDNRTWFFKMTGDDAVVASAKADFITFLASIQFNEN